MSTIVIERAEAKSATPGATMPALTADVPSNRFTWLPTAVLGAVVLLTWEGIARFVFDGKSVMAPPTAIVGNVVSRWSSYSTHISATIKGATMGWLWGNLVAVALGVLAVVVPFLERWVMRLAIAVSSLPIIAIAPIFQVTMAGDGPKITLAAMAVFFTTLIGTIVGLRSADRTSLEVVRALGGGRGTQLVKVRMRAALPSFFAALRISAPAAVLGSIIGEFLGRVEKGLGVALVNAQRNVQTDRVWGVALVSTALAGAGYFIIATIGRKLTPWAPKEKGR